MGGGSRWIYTRILRCSIYSVFEPFHFCSKIVSRAMQSLLLIRQFVITILKFDHLTNSYYTALLYYAVQGGSNL